MPKSIEEVSKPKGIEQISSQLGIKGSSGSFDFAKDQAEQRQLEDTRQFTKGGKGAAPSVPSDAKRNEQRAIEAGLAPDPNSINKSIFASEASPEDKKNGTYSAYFEKSTNTYNIGPGLNLDSPLVIKSLESRGISSEELKDIHDFDNKQTIDPELQKVMEGVFDDVVDGARKDARTYVGAGVWNKLKKYEKDALTDMSYNMGLKKLG
jgi:hypothetical protein